MLEHSYKLTENNKNKKYFKNIVDQFTNMPNNKVTIKKIFVY